MSIKNYIIIISSIALVAGIFGAGYKTGSYTIKDGDTVTTESKPITHEIIKYVDRNNSDDINAALNAPIYIKRDYSDLIGGYITADIVADDGYKKSSVQDKIKVIIKQDVKNQILLGYGFYIADRIIYSAPEISYMRRLGKLSFGAGVAANTWDAHQIYGIKIIAGIDF